MTRIHVLKREQMNAEQGKVYDDVQAEGGPLGGPYWAYIRMPKLMRQLQDVTHTLAQGGLTKRERQVAVMATIRFWGAEYPWAVQSRASLAMGLTQEFLDAVNSHRAPSLTDPREKMAFDLAKELLSSHKISDTTWGDASKMFDEKALVSLIATIGQFTMTCLTTISYDCTPPDDVPHRLKH